MTIQSLNPLQEVFSLFYAITWGSLTNVWPRWKAFDWSSIPNEGGMAVRRCLLSILMLNALPIAFFIVVFYLLGGWVLGGGWRMAAKLAVVLVQPFVLIGFYWLWCSIVQRFRASFYPQPLTEDYPSLREAYDLDRKRAATNLRFGLVYVLGPAVLFVASTICSAH